MGYKHGSIDLHIHSNASDGSLSPGQILDHAVECGLAAIAITDHDTVKGVRAALDRGIPENLDFLSGVEISAGFPPGFEAGGSMHILAYGIDTEDCGLNELLGRQQQARQKRNPEIIKKLRSLGIDITLKDAEAKSGGKDPARPHIAACLVEKGYARDIDEAFDRYLAKGKPAYVDKFRIPAGQCIQTIDRAGGIPVLAHPGLLPENVGRNLEKLVFFLKDIGLWGIEAYYPGHGPEETAYYESLASDLGLLVTGGTDFHGDINPEIRMGCGRGDLAISYRVFEKLAEALKQKKKRPHPPGS